MGSIQRSSKHHPIRHLHLGSRPLVETDLEAPLATLRGKGDPHSVSLFVKNSAAHIVAEPPTDRILPGDVVVRCPKCQAIGGVSLLVIRADVIRADPVPRIVSIPYGDRMACQRCPHVYSVDPTGVFDHNPRSLPYPTEAPHVPGVAPPAPDPDNSPEPPMFKTRPRL